MARNSLKQTCKSPIASPKTMRFTVTNVKKATTVIVSTIVFIKSIHQLSMSNFVSSNLHRYFAGGRCCKRPSLCSFLCVVWWREHVSSRTRIAKTRTTTALVEQKQAPSERQGLGRGQRRFPPKHHRGGQRRTYTTCKSPRASPEPRNIRREIQRTFHQGFGMNMKLSDFADFLTLR